jgi:aldehyde:ferredoxin oxidoreductase
MHGFYNLLLRVDLTQQSYELQMIPDGVLQRTLGGKGLATHLLLKHNPAGVDPLGPDNHLIFATGPAAVYGVHAAMEYSPSLRKLDFIPNHTPAGA